MILSVFFENNKIVLLSLCIICQILAIDQKCEQSRDCPTNAYCDNQYCICDSPYILGCQTQSLTLTSNPQTYTITNQKSYFTVQPIRQDSFIVFTFYLCSHKKIQLEDYQFVFEAYTNTGNINLNSQNYIGERKLSISYINSLNGQCIGFAQTQAMLKFQPNNEPQNIICLVYIQPEKVSSSSQDPQIEIILFSDQQQMVQNDVFLHVSIGIICSAFGVGILAIILCCYYRWKIRMQQNQKAQQKKNMIDHIKNQMPQIQVNTLKLSMLTSCSICLSQFQPQQKVRKLVCSHIFHSNCIDSWCLKNLNCPVCRFQLDIQSIKNKKKQLLQSSHLKWQQNDLSKRDILVENNQNIYQSA